MLFRIVMTKIKRLKMELNQFFTNFSMMSTTIRLGLLQYLHGYNNNQFYFNMNYEVNRVNPSFYGGKYCILTSHLAILASDVIALMPIPEPSAILARSFEWP